MTQAWPTWMRWTWMLPVLELLVASAIAGPPALQLFRHPPRLCRDADGKTVYDMRDPAVRRWLNDDVSPFPPRFDDVIYLNFPGAVVDLAILTRKTWPYPYSPYWSWPIGIFGFRALTWPVWALPFWVAAGRGLDAVFGQMRISALEAFTMGVLSVLMGYVALAAEFGSTVASEHPYWRWAGLPAAMWFIFGVICQIAWWRQSRHPENRYGAGVAGRLMRRYFW